MADIQKTIEIIFGGIDNTGTAFSSIGKNINKFESSVGSVTGPLADFTESLLKTEAAVLTLAAAYGGYAVSEAIKFQSAQIDLEKVLSDTDPSVESFTETVIALSEQYGVASDSILQGIANFKQAGFTAEEAALLQKNALDLVIAGDVEASQATEILIASLKGFGAEATESARFIEALNNVSNEYATDLGELSGGMSRISPVAKQMGFSFEETTGLITPIIEVFRSGPEAANALRTGLLKLIDDSKPVGDALAQIGVSQFDLNGEMRSGKDIFLDVATAFQTLDDNQKLVITSQLVGIEQAGKMVAVFDNLGKVQAITNTAMKETGSVSEEVSKRLESAEKQIDRLVTSFNNLSKSIGDKLLPGFNETTDGAIILIQAFRDVVESGGLAPLFDSLNEQGAAFGQFLKDIAKALPEAFEQLDLSGLLDSFDNLKDSVAGIFGDLDLTNADDLATTLQGIVDFLSLLTNASSGAVRGLEPLIDGITSFLQALSSSDTDLISFLGNVGGIATSINVVLPALGFMADAIILIGGASKLLNAKGTAESVVSMASNFGNLSTSLTKMTPLATAVAAAVASITFAVNENVSAYQEYKARQEELAATEEHAADLREQAADRLSEISDRTGVVVNSMKELNAQVDAGNLVFDELTGTYVKAIDGIKVYDEEVAAVAENQKKSAISTEDFADAVTSLSNELVKGETGLTRNQKATQDLAAAIKEADRNGQSYRIVFRDGVEVLETFGDANKKASEEINKTADATDKLTEREKIAIENTQELEKVMLELASNERIAAMDFTAEIQVADIQAQAEQVVAAFDSIGTAVEATQSASASIFGDLVDAFGSLSSYDLLAVEEYARKQQKQAQQALDTQQALTEAQIRAMDARTQALLNGQGLITIVADSLEPELQLVLRSLVENIQIQANSEGLELLLP